MALEQFKNGLDIPDKEIDLMLNRVTEMNGNLCLPTTDWGPVIFTIQQNKRVVALRKTADVHRWKAELPRNSQYLMYSQKQGCITFCEPKVSEKGILRTLGFCVAHPTPDGVTVDPNTYLRFKPYIPKDVGYAQTWLETPDTDFSHVTLALVEMNLPAEEVFGDLPKSLQDNIRTRMNLPAMESQHILHEKKIGNVLGMFHFGIQSSEKND